MENLIKPYEISVWKTKVNNNTNQIIEEKVAIIGSDTMTGLNRVYDPVFNKKSNGEKTLTFSLKYKYFDPYSGNSEVINPFAALLVNEQKIKLHYDNEWYEFIIKEHQESSDELTWTYSCVDAYVLELSKNGYNITFNEELDNNQGTARELVKETIKNTDWRLGEINAGKQFIAEPIYKAQLINDVNIINASGNEESIPTAIADIYVFYSYIKNKDGKFVQFIIRDENRKYNIDDNNIITDTNFRVQNELIYDERLDLTDNKINKGFWLNDTLIIKLITEENGDSINPIEIRYQANRLIYNQLTTYDPITQRVVERYKADNEEIYRYVDTLYTTSNVVTNYITNGDSFNILDDGSLQGWSSYVDNQSTINELELISNPEIGTDKRLVELASLSQIESYLKINFNGPKRNSNNKIYNTIYNSGLSNNAYHIDSIAKGEKFVFRWRAKSGENIDTASSANNLRAMIAQYTQDEDSSGYIYKHINPQDIIVEFSGAPIESNNIIDGGTIDLDTNTYIIDGVPQAISTKYVYKDMGEEEELYVWDSLTNSFKKKSTDPSYVDYYYLVGEARRSITNFDLNDPNKHFGIFIYYVDLVGTSSSTFYIQDIQLTRFIPDGVDSAEQKPICIGNIPKASAQSIYKYYLKPSDNTTINNIKFYISLDEIQNEYSFSEILPLYNEDSEKVLSISANQSNCFNILQTIAETFECWIDLAVEHDENGYVQYTDNLPNKFVYLREYAGKDNWAGFKYGINLQSIERTVNSDEIVTKLIVPEAQSDYVDRGYVSIAEAPSNNSGEGYILNFDYYYNQQLLDRDEAETDRLEFISKIAVLNSDLTQKEKEARSLQQTLIALESQRNIYAELIITAEDNKNQALDSFKQQVDEPYKDYIERHPVIPTTQRLTEDETIADILGKLYINSATINNYSGLLINVNKEYWNTRKKLYGSEKYGVKIWVEKDINHQRHVCIEFSDYLDGLSFDIDNHTYTVTTNQKYFEIITEATNVYFRNTELYYVSVNDYPINDNVIFNNEIVTNDNVIGIEEEINKIIEQKNIIINDFENKYRRFIQEGTWSSTDYLDSERYYLDAIQVSNTSAQPIVSYTINITEISELEGFEHYSFDVGDKTYIEDTDFFGWGIKNGVLTPAREEVIVSEIEWHLDKPEENVVTIQNYKTRFEDLFQRISATVQTVEYNEATYAKIDSLMDADGTINQTVLLQSLNNISGKQYNLTSDGSILIDGDQILVRNLTNTSNLVKINSEGIRISADGGATWATAIDGRGINIGTVYTGILNTDQVIIGNSNNPSFRWDKSGISAYRFVNRIEPTRTRGLLRAATEDDSQGYDLQTYVRFDQYGLYGIKNSQGFKTIKSLEDIKNKAHFAITWDGFFIKNTYEGGGQVEITSDNDFRVLTDQEQQGNFKETIKIGALEWGKDEQNNPIISPDATGATALPTLYGIRIKNNDEEEVFKTGTNGNIEITGTINATAGNFRGIVNVGQQEQNHIIIDGSNEGNSPSIKTSNYGPGAGWMINKDGDAVFNNITARGAIKTAVFEYAEIQAVGGIFIFRPSSTIRSAIVDNQNLILTVEKPILFKEGDWCKVSNYTSIGEADNPDVDIDDEQETSQNILQNNGLTNIYQISNITTEENKTYITLNGAAAMIGDEGAIASELDIIGGALVDMGKDPNDAHYDNGIHNYGIGINSSDNAVNLPRRAISLFETIINENTELSENESSVEENKPKVIYNYRGIFGTLPELSYSGENPQVDELYHHNLEETQGIYTDNIYLGDASNYLSFYTDKDTNKKHLVIKASEIKYELDGEYVNVADAAKYIWYSSGNEEGSEAGAHIASGNNEPFDYNNSNTFGYNILAIPTGLQIRNNGNVLAEYGQSIKLYSEAEIESNIKNPSLQIENDRIIIGNTSNETSVHIEIDDISLGFYRAYSEGATEEETASIRKQARISYLDREKLYIPYSVVLNEMIVGTRDTDDEKRKHYIISSDQEVNKQKDYYRRIVDGTQVRYIKIDKAEIDSSADEHIIPADEGWYEVDTSDLWAWQVTSDEHLRLVWKARVVK